ncbi:hypothetical protein C8R44DRAFT_948597 [Mycena epipterygia]|nr:hypothetical protein C8R44DRAFT_948597 [Mycena epipterygia]
MPSPPTKMQDDRAFPKASDGIARSSALATIRLFSRFARWAPQFPSRNDPVIKRAWTATPNAIVAKPVLSSDDATSPPSDGSAHTETLAPKSLAEIDSNPELVILLEAIPASQTPSRISQVAVTTVSSTTAPSPPPSPRCAPTILDSEGEREFRYYRKMLQTANGVSTCLRSLLGLGVKDAASAQPIARLTHRLSANRADALRARIRSEALGMFSSYWRQDGAWRQELHKFSPYILSRGVNIAGFMGSLYRVGILSGADAHECLDGLLGTGLHFLKLLAAHALFVQCGKRICAGESGVRTAVLRERISARDLNGSGCFVWGPNEESNVLVLDLLDNIDRWFAAQTMKRIRAEHPGIILPGTTPRNTPEGSVGSNTPDGSVGSSPTVSSVTVITPRSTFNAAA